MNLRVNIEYITRCGPEAGKPNVATTGDVTRIEVVQGTLYLYKDSKGKRCQYPLCWEIDDVISVKVVPEECCED